MSSTRPRIAVVVEANPKPAAAVEEGPGPGVLHHAVAAFLVILLAVLTTGGFVLLWVELFERGEKMYRGPIAALILAGGVVVSMLAGAFLRCRAGRWWFVFYLVLAGLLWAVWCCLPAVLLWAVLWGGGIGGLLHSYGSGDGFFEVLLLFFLPTLCWFLGVLLSLRWRSRPPTL